METNEQYRAHTSHAQLKANLFARAINFAMKSGRVSVRLSYCSEVTATSLNTAAASAFDRYMNHKRCLWKLIKVQVQQQQEEEVLIQRNGHETETKFGANVRFLHNLLFTLTTHYVNEKFAVVSLTDELSTCRLLCALKKTKFYCFPHVKWRLNVKQLVTNVGKRKEENTND